MRFKKPELARKWERKRRREMREKLSQSRVRMWFR